MATKRKTLWTAVLAVVVSVLLAIVGSAWAYTNGVEKRLSSCEVWVIGSHADIQEIKREVKELRAQQMEMWLDLRGRIDKEP